jgi:FtsP/CotA-like multicopper oxidase with cupredoxin domain
MWIVKIALRAWMRAPDPVPGESGKHYKPTVTPNGSTLPWKVIDGVKVMHLTAGEVEHEFVPSSDDNEPLRALCWGYNGQVHGPTIECLEGDQLRIYSANTYGNTSSMPGLIWSTSTSNGCVVKSTTASRQS